MTTEAQSTEQQRRKLGELATAEQRLAADPTLSVWVNASAGTGKTKVLSDRVLRLLLAGVNPGRLLCLTYTKAAAVEMSARVSKKLSGWAVASEQELENELDKLYGTLPQDQKQAEELKARARKLFAVLLDTPGGIKIQTIHSFCQEILKRFPLEAGVSPYFEIMDDRAAAEAAEEIKNRLIAEIRGNPGSPAAEAMAFLTENVSELKFPEIIGTIINERGKISRLFKRWSSAGELLAAQAARLGVAPNADERELNRLFFDALPREELKTLLAAWLKSGVRFARRAEKPGRRFAKFRTGRLYRLCRRFPRQRRRSLQNRCRQSGAGKQPAAGGNFCRRSRTGTGTNRKTKSTQGFSGHQSRRRSCRRTDQRLRKL